MYWFDRQRVEQICFILKEYQFNFTSWQRLNSLQEIKRMDGFCMVFSTMSRILFLSAYTRFLVPRLRIALVSCTNILIIQNNLSDYLINKSFSIVSFLKQGVSNETTNKLVSHLLTKYFTESWKCYTDTLSCFIRYLFLTRRGVDLFTNLNGELTDAKVVHLFF